MAKQPAAEAHPALIHVQQEEDAATNYDFDIDGIPNWDAFSNEQREFLMALPFYRTVTATAKALGKAENYGRNVLMRNEKLSAAITYIQNNKGGLLKQQRQDLIFQALQVLRRATTPNENGDYETIPNSALTAAQFLFKVNGLATADFQPKDPSPTFINVHGGGRLNLGQRATELE